MPFDAEFDPKQFFKEEMWETENKNYIKNKYCYKLKKCCSEFDEYKCREKLENFLLYLIFLLKIYSFGNPNSILRASKYSPITLAGAVGSKNSGFVNILINPSQS